MQLAFCSEAGARSHTDASLQIHENSPTHKGAVRLWQIATQELDSVQIADIFPDTVEKGFDTQSEIFQRGIERKIRTAYFIGKEDILENLSDAGRTLVSDIISFHESIIIN